jgi:hypothetical protein
LSIEAINWALNKVRGVSSTQKAILVALADRADVNAQCFPSYEDICVRSGATRNAVARALNYFEENGLVSRQQRHNKSTVYTLNLTSTQFNTDSSSTEFDTSSSTELKTSTSTEFDTLTTKEPSINHQKKKHSRKTPEGVDPQAWSEWVKYRRKFKAPTTERALTLVANKLKGCDPEAQREAVDKAIECGWRSVFPKQKDEIREWEV